MWARAARTGAGWRTWVEDVVALPVTGVVVQRATGWGGGRSLQATAGRAAVPSPGWVRSTVSSVNTAAPVAVGRWVPTSVRARTPPAAAAVGRKVATSSGAGSPRAPASFALATSTMQVPVAAPIPGPRGGRTVSVARRRWARRRRTLTGLGVSGFLGFAFRFLLGLGFGLIVWFNKRLEMN